MVMAKMEQKIMVEITHTTDSENFHELTGLNGAFCNSILYIVDNSKTHVNAYGVWGLIINPYPFKFS